MLSDLTAEMPDRRIAAIRSILKQRPRLPISEAGNVAAVLSAAVKQLQSGADYLVEPVCSLLDLLRTPFKPYAPVDAAKAADGIVEAVHAIASCLLLNDVNVQTAAAAVRV